MRAKVMTERYARDLMRDPLYAWLEARKNWMKVGFCVLAAFRRRISGALVTGHRRRVSVRRQPVHLGWRARTVFVWHTTWAVNSVTHMWGYRNYQTPDDSRTIR